jgi:anthranilate phosphoribosyltransferase
MKEILEQLCAGIDLTMEQSKSIFEQIISGKMSPVFLSAFLMLLKKKGESVDEITGAAQVLLQFSKPFVKPEYEFADLVGTGGDGFGTVNVSTAAAFVVAELGLPVAKHGNVSVSSRCGSADVLEKCGGNLNLNPEQSRQCLDEVGICFLLAPKYHESLRYVMPVRHELKTRTIFNLLGPLVNPARPDYQLTGVYHPDLCLPMINTLKKLGSKFALVVHGSGLDEIALHGETTGALLQAGEIRNIVITPEEAGLKRYPLESILGGSPDENAILFKQILLGQAPEAHLAAVALNAGALFWIYKSKGTLKEAVQAAYEVLKSKHAYARFEKLMEFTQRDT